MSGLLCTSRAREVLVQLTSMRTVVAIVWQAVPPGNAHSQSSFFAMTADRQERLGRSDTDQLDAYASLAHMAFIDSLAAMTEGDRRWRQTVAGFLTMRAVDAWRRPALDGSDSSIPWHPQMTAGARRAIEEIDAQHAIRLALYRVVEGLGETSPAAPHHLLVGLIGYGRALEFEAEWALAIDVHETVLEHAEWAQDGHCAGQAALRLGFGHRVLARHDVALGWYRRAEQIGIASGELGTELRGRIGIGKVALERGNYSLARVLLEEVERTAEEAGHVEERSQALHELSDIAFRAGDHTRALHLLHEALGGYTIQADRDRALNDLAVNFVELGLLDAARDAYLVVLATAQEQSTRWLAMLNLLTVVGPAGDRAAVERYRQELMDAALPPGLEFAFWNQLGTAYAALGDVEAAEAALTRAVAIAREHRLHGREFEAERQMAQLAESRSVGSRSAPIAAPEAVEIAVAVRDLRLQVCRGA